MIYCNIWLLRPLEIKTTIQIDHCQSQMIFFYDIVFDIKTTSLIRPLLSSPKGGLNIGIFLYSSSSKINKNSAWNSVFH